MTAPWSKAIAWSVFRIVLIAMLLSGCSGRAAAEEFAAAIQAYLQHCLGARSANLGIVVGLVDEHGTRVVGYGKLDNGTDQQVNGDTVFEIGSDTKTFTALLLQDMVERGEMNLDHPVARYLPESVDMPARNGKQITLRHLATHTSGLPSVPENLDPQRADNPYADYTIEKMYAFLSGYQLTRDPGAKSEYSNLGMGLLGHVLARKAGSSYESLVVDRICRPLEMDSTRITLPPELKSRFATPHNQFGEPVPSWDAPTLAGAGALRSTANDLLKYVSANLSLTPSSLTPLMDQTHDLGLAWSVTTDEAGTTIIYHGGGTGGCRTFPAFDKGRRRGVVVLTNSKGVIDLEDLGLFLLNSEWRSDRRPTAIKISSDAYAAYTGQYQRAPGFASRVATMQLIPAIPNAAIYSVVLCGLAALGVCVWRVDSFRKRVVLLGGAVLMIGALVAVVKLAPSQATDAAPEPGIGLRRDDDRLFAEAIGLRSSPVKMYLPPNAGELLPESETRFFERLSGHPIIFYRDTRGKQTRWTAHFGGDAFVYEKFSDQPPEAAEPLKPRVAIKLDKELLDAFVGHYEFAPNATYPTGIKARIWREGEQLLWEELGQNAIRGAIEIYPESPTSFFTKIDAARLTFNRNGNEEVTAVLLHLEGSPELTGTRVAND